VWTPTFSKTRPRIIDMVPPPPLPASRCHGVFSKRPGDHEACGPCRSCSICSKAAQMRSRSVSNHSRAFIFFCSMSAGSPAGISGRCKCCLRLSGAYPDK
jgi:hypothetical protein